MEVSPNSGGPLCSAAVTVRVSAPHPPSPLGDLLFPVGAKLISISMVTPDTVSVPGSSPHCQLYMSLDFFSFRNGLRAHPCSAPRTPLQWFPTAACCASCFLSSVLITVQLCLQLRLCSLFCRGRHLLGYKAYRAGIVRSLVYYEMFRLLRGIRGYSAARLDLQFC